MTWREQTWVEDFSPYTGGAYATHLVLACLVNPDHDFEIWVHPSKLAERCHCSVSTLRRQLATMVDDGYLELAEVGGGRTNINRYRLLMTKPTQNGQVSEGPTEAGNLAKPDGNLPISERETYPNQDSHYLLTKIGNKGNKGGAGFTVAEREGSLEISTLCFHLQGAITRYRDDPRRTPQITKQWLKDFRLLLEKGPDGRNEPEPLTPDRVHTAIDFVFTALATPLGPNHFCWAGVIQSPGALRRDWDKVYDAGLKIKRAAGLDPLAEFRNRNHAVAAAVGLDPLAEFRRPAVTR